MKTIGFFDLEADGLLDEATKMHCLVWKLAGHEQPFFVATDALWYKLEAMFKCDILVGHNIIEYDLPLIKKLYDLDYHGQVQDTLVMSRALNSDRPMPPGCTRSVEVEGQAAKRKITPHSLEAWGYRVAKKKPEVQDWKDQPIQVYVDRCVEDVKITELTYYALLSEGKLI